MTLAALKPALQKAQLFKIAENSTVTIKQTEMGIQCLNAKVVRTVRNQKCIIKMTSERSAMDYFNPAMQRFCHCCSSDIDLINAELIPHPVYSDYGMRMKLHMLVYMTKIQRFSRTLKALCEFSRTSLPV